MLRFLTGDDTWQIVIPTRNDSWRKLVLYWNNLWYSVLFASNITGVTGGSLLFVYVCYLFDWAVFLRTFLLSCLIDEHEASFLQFSVSRAATCAKVLLVFAFASKSWGIKNTKWFGVQPLRSVYWVCVHTMTACEEHCFFAGWMLIFMQLRSIREPWTQGYTDIMEHPVALHRANMCHIFEYLDGLIVSIWWMVW